MLQQVYTISMEDKTMMCFEKDLVNKAIALIDEKSKSDELKAFTDVNDINNMIRNLQINRDYQCDAIKLNQRLINMSFIKISYFLID